MLQVAVHSSVDLYSRVALLLYPNNSYTATSASYDKETTFLHQVSTIASSMNTSDTTMSPLRTNLLTSGGPIFYSVLFVAIYHIVWPIIPYFICDIVFYVLLWWPLFSVLLGLGIVYFIRRGVFNNIIRQ